MERVEALLSEAGQAGRETAVVSLTDLPPDGVLPFRSADAWGPQVAGFAPAPWAPNQEDVTGFADALEGSFDTFWLSDGVARDSRDGLLEALQDRGLVTVFESPRSVLGLKPARYEDGNILLSAVRSRTTSEGGATVIAHGLDPAGTPRALARVGLEFATGEAEATETLVLPAELRDRVTRFEIEGLRSAGAVSLTDDSLRRPRNRDHIGAGRAGRAAAFGINPLSGACFGDQC